MNPFSNRDVKLKILDYAKASCGDMTYGYRDCRPPFRYKNSSTGQVKSCYKDCFANIDKWVTPLLQTAPQRAVLVSKQRKTERIVDYANKRIIIHEPAGMRAVYVFWMNTKLADTKEWLSRQEKGDYSLPQSLRDAGLEIKRRLHANRSLTKLNIHLPMMLDSRATFPGNEVWQRFARFMQAGDLVLDFA